MNPNVAGGAAFPRPASIDPTHGTLPDGDDLVSAQPGMTLRDWFAGQVMTGYLTAYVAEQGSLPLAHLAARDVYRFADAMLSARRTLGECPFQSSDPRHGTDPTCAMHRDCREQSATWEDDQ